MARKRRHTETTEEAHKPADATPVESAPENAAEAPVETPIESAPEQPAEERAVPEAEQPAEDNGRATEISEAASDAPAAEGAAAEADAAGEGAEPAPGTISEPELTPEQQRERLKRGIESLLFITDHPLPLAKLAKCAGLTVKEHKKAVELIEELRREMEERNSAVQIV